MTQGQLQIFLYSTDVHEIGEIRASLNQAPNLRAVVGTGAQVTKAHHLDALWMAPMQATYFGITEVLPAHKAKVFATPQEKRELGLPRFIIVGVTLLPGKQYSEQALRVLPATALRDAVDAFNEWSVSKIMRVGSRPQSLLDMNHLGPSLLALRNTLISATEAPAASVQVQKVSA